MDYLLISGASVILGLALGGTVGWLVTFLFVRNRVITVSAEMTRLMDQHERDRESIAWIDRARDNLERAFESLSSKSLRANAADFSQRINTQLSSHASQIGAIKQSLEMSINQLALHNRQQTADYADKIKLQLGAHATQIGVIKQSLETSINQLAVHNRQQTADYADKIKLQLGAHATQIDVIKKSLEGNIGQLDRNVRELEVKRVEAYQQLARHVVELERAHDELRGVTQQLLSVLKSGPVRGKWGEMQLRRIVELAGMSKHVDFDEQAVEASGRPDMIVHLPDEGLIAVDSKFPLQAFLEAMEATDDKTRKEKIAEHTKVLRQTITNLSNKEYWRELELSPELVVLFIPIESCLMAAYEHDREIIEFALEKKIVLASPTTFLGFMKAIAFGWQQYTINKNARKILQQARELHDRIDIWVGHFRKTGEKLEAVGEAYNKCVGSLQSRFFPACRKFEELSAIAEELDDVETINNAIRLAPHGQMPDGEHLAETAPAALAANPLPDLFSPQAPKLRPQDVSVIVIHRSADDGSAPVVNDMQLWRLLYERGCKCYRYDHEQKDSQGNLIVDSKGWAAIVGEVGLPILLVVELSTGAVLNQTRLPGTREEVLQILASVIDSDIVEAIGRSMAST
jgi:DNA recombination protein RmuC